MPCEFPPRCRGTDAQGTWDRRKESGTHANPSYTGPGRSRTGGTQEPGVGNRTSAATCSGRWRCARSGPDAQLAVRRTEIGAERVGTIQCLLATCTLQGVDSYTYLVDVLQRVEEHPASRAVELTPQVWRTRTLFADDPLRSDFDRARDPPTG